MTELAQQTPDEHRQWLEAGLARRVAELFERCPVLCGFTVKAAAADFGELDLTCFPTPSRERANAVFGEVTEMLLDLEEELPEAARLLPGRTFARTFH